MCVELGPNPSSGTHYYGDWVKESNQTQCPCQKVSGQSSESFVCLFCFFPSFFFLSYQGLEEVGQPEALDLRQTHLWDKVQR